MPLRALTVYQPWASLIVIGAKPYEFRGWPAPLWLIGLRIVIHAAVRPLNLGEIEFILKMMTHRPETSCLLVDKARPFLESLRTDLLAGTVEIPYGAGVGTAIVGPPRSGWEIAEEFSVEKVNDSDRDAHANYGWPMLEPEQWADPIPCRGRQRIWKWRVDGGLES